MTNEKLCAAMCRVLADTFMFYYMAHQFHWNVTGMNFDALHSFFGGLYEDAHGAVDAIAEHIRALDKKIEPGLAYLIGEATVKEVKSDTLTPDEMITLLGEANGKVVMSLDKAYTAAEEMNECGLANFLQDRLDQHAKNYWQIKAHR